MSLHRESCLAVLLLAVASAAAPTRADEADDRYAVAAGHYSQGRWELAVTEFQTFLQRHPDHSKTHQGVFFLAEALLQTGDTEQAAGHFRRYLDSQPEGKYGRAALFRAGEAAYLAGKPGRAKTELKQFRSKYPNDKLNAYVLPYLGDLALAEDDVDAAVRYFQAGLSLFPQGRLLDDCRFGLARALERQGRNDEAKDLYKAVAAKPEGPLADDAQCHLGVLQYATGEHAEAIRTFSAFETTMADSPWLSNARLGHGWALRKLGRLEEAKAMFRKITSDAKVGMDAWYWLAVVQRTEQDWPAAAESMASAARAAGPKHHRAPDVRFHAGDCLLRAGRPKEAIEQFDLAIAWEAMASGAAGNEWVDDAIRGKVQAALELKDHAEVDRCAARFRQQFPQSPLAADVHRALAQSLLQRKQHAQAAELIEPLTAAGTLDGQGVQDRYLLALAYQGLKRDEEALAVVLPVLDSRAIDGLLKADALLMQGTLLVAMQRYAEAVKPLEEFLGAADPAGEAVVKGRAELAICYARAGRLGEAKQTYARLLQAHGEHELILPTVEQLAEAAYEASDFTWASQLFARLENQGSKQYVSKGLAGLAWCQLKTERLTEAAATFGRLLDSDPPAEMAAEAAMARGGVLQRMGRLDTALAMYDLVINQHRNTQQHPQAMLAAARLRDRLQQDRESAQLYRRLAEEYSDFTEADAVLYEWAWVLDELGKTDESTGLFVRLRKEHPQSRYRTDATYRLARRAYLAEDHDRASELIAEVLAGGPADQIREDTLDLRGHVAVARGDWDRAEAAFVELIDQFPQTPKRLVAEYYIADAAYLRKEYEETARRFEQLSRKIRGRREAWLAIVPLRHAQALAQLDKWSEAHGIASKIEADHPGFEQQFEADYLIGRCKAAQSDLEGARDSYQKVIRSPAGGKTETAAMAQLMIAETYWHQKNYAAAAREYWRVEMRFAYPTWQSLALLQIGKCHEKLGEWKEAAAAYARLLRVYPDTDSAGEASRRLKTAPKSQSGAGTAD